MAENSWCPIIDALLYGKSLSDYWKLTTQHIPELFSIHSGLYHACSFTYCMNSDTSPGVTRDMRHFLVIPYTHAGPCIIF